MAAPLMKLAVSMAHAHASLEQMACYRRRRYGALTDRRDTGFRRLDYHGGGSFLSTTAAGNVADIPVNAA